MIVGGGLAGSFLAASLLEKGHAVTLVDEPDAGTASRNAAGLFNIITGRLAKKTWQAELFLETIRKFLEKPRYQALKACMNHATIYRPFQTPYEYNEWSAKSAEPGFRNIVNIIEKPRQPEIIHNPWGGLEILPCGWANIGQLIHKLKTILKQQAGLNWKEYRFDYQALDPATGRDHQDAAHETYDAIVFAEGVKCLQNPWFGDLDIRPLKGQLFEVEIPHYKPDYLLSRKAYLIPQGNGRFLTGSTYEKTFTDTQPDEKGRQEIAGHLEALFKIPFRIGEGKAAVRATTPNRRPVAGRHPHHPKLWILNGMGTKGLLQAPWMAALLAEKISGDHTPFPREVALERFIKQFS